MKRSRHLSGFSHNGTRVRKKKNLDMSKSDELSVTHVLGRQVSYSHEGVELLNYVYDNRMDAKECPTPYVHSLRTLTGGSLTNNRPHDHRWHKGLTMTCAELNGHNFWGGPTYVRDKGYEQLGNVGRMDHVAFTRMDGDGFTETLRWVTPCGACWVEETRGLRVASIDEAAGSWTLELSFQLTNVSGILLEWGSPTTVGRPNAGYGGLFWRGPRDFTKGTILASDGREGEEMMGQTSPWLAYSGAHDSRDGGATLLFVDGKDNPPTKWFCRSGPFAAVSASFMFDEVYEQAPEATIELEYRIVILEGQRKAEELEKKANGVRQ